MARQEPRQGQMYTKTLKTLINKKKQQNKNPRGGKTLQTLDNKH